MRTYHKNPILLPPRRSGLITRPALVYRSAWSPLDLAPLVLLDTDSPGFGAGQYWRDRSGHGNDAMLGSTTGVDAQDPAWIASGLQFDGVDDTAATPDFAWSDDLTLIVMAQYDSIPNSFPHLITLHSDADAVLFLRTLDGDASRIQAVTGIGFGAAAGDSVAVDLLSPFAVKVVLASSMVEIKNLSTGERTSFANPITIAPHGHISMDVVERSHKVSVCAVIPRATTDREDSSIIAHYRERGLVS